MDTNTPNVPWEKADVLIISKWPTIKEYIKGIRETGSLWPGKMLTVLDQKTLLILTLRDKHNLKEFRNMTDEEIAAKLAHTWSRLKKKGRTVPTLVKRDENGVVIQCLALHELCD